MSSNGATEREHPEDSSRSDSNSIVELRSKVSRLEKKLGRRPKLLVGRPGLDGDGEAEQLALKARDAGFDVVYEVIEATPERIVVSAVEEGAHLIGIAMSTGSPLELIPRLVERARAAGIGEVPIIACGNIPEPLASELRAAGVARVYAPQDFERNATMDDLAKLASERTADTERPAGR